MKSLIFTISFIAVFAGVGALDTNMALGTVISLAGIAGMYVVAQRISD